MLQQTLKGAPEGPIVVMIHGYRYSPGHHKACPHRRILSDSLDSAWPSQLGFDDKGAGLAVTFGWNTSGTIGTARRRSASAGRALVRLIERLQAAAPNRPIHLMAHSLGIAPILHALPALPARSIGTVLSLNGACFAHEALAALASPAGRTCEFLNVTSRENDLFDFLFERWIAPHSRSGRAIGQGMQAPNAVTLRLDCQCTLDHLASLGWPVAAPQRRICHRSTYTRPGVMQFYAALLRNGPDLSLDRIRVGLPDQSTRRWSRLLARPHLPLLPPLPLPFWRKHS